MNRSLLFLLIIAITASNCDLRSKQITEDPDITEVIATCITATVGNSDSAKYFHKLMPEFIPYQTFDSKRYNDSMKQLLDTALNYILVRDTLGIGCYQEDKDYLKETIELSNKRSNTDTFKTISTLDKEMQVLSLGTIEKKLGIRTVNKIEKINNRNRMIGYFGFSKVSFNPLKNKAAVILSFMGSGKDGFGDLFLLEKNNGKWIVTKRDRTWIS